MAWCFSCRIQAAQTGDSLCMSGVEGFEETAIVNWSCCDPVMNSLSRGFLPTRGCTSGVPLAHTEKMLLTRLKVRPPDLFTLHRFRIGKQLIVGRARGPENQYEQTCVQDRAREVVANNLVNRWAGPNCEHISSYIRNGNPVSPQLAAGVGVGVVLGLLWLFCLS